MPCLLLIVDKFKGKYRIPSARWQDWDYGWNGAYFITICTKNRIHYFGKVINGKMQLSYVGVVANILWYETKHHANHLELGEFVVMPNHIHGILILNNDDNQRRDKACLVSTNTDTATNDPTIGQQRWQNQGKNTISSIVGGYEFAWQSRFHDYVIRNDIAYDRIVKYVRHNPQNWHQDKFHVR